MLLIFLAIPALAQTPSPTGSPSASVKIAPPGPPASYYAAYGLIAIAALTLVAVLAGWLFQAPGFRRSGRGTASPTD